MTAPRTVPAPLPAIVVGGYLGAGKTTLVNHLLHTATGRRLAVLVNDFGKIAIDAALIAAREGESMTLANGCVCCSIGGDLYRALTWALDRRPRADALVIEASGVAEPARIAEIARAEPELRLAGIVVLVDAGAWPERSADPLVGKLLKRQVAAATHLVLNKCDLVADTALDALEADVRALALHAGVQRVRHGRMDLQDILAAETKIAAAPESTAHSHEDEFTRWSLEGDFKVSRAALDAFLARLPQGVHRLKGFVTLKGDSSPVLVQAEGGRVNLTPAPPNVPAATACRLIAIGPRGRFDPEDLDALVKHWRRV